MVKQVIILRTTFPDGKGGTFKPRKGKMVAQGAHASMKVFFDHLVVVGDGRYELGPCEDWDWPVVKSWIEGLFTKIVVGCTTEAELLDLKAKAEASHLPWALIQDAGLTEFGGVPTYTSLAIGPAEDTLIDPITGHLTLL